MRKMIYILLAALVLMLAGCGEKVEDPKFISTACHHEFLKNGVVTGTDDFFYTCNSQGLVTDGERWQDGLLTEQTHWDYDDMGNPIRITTEGTDTAQISEYKNALDDKGRIIRQETWVNGSLSMLREITYNRQGKETSHHLTSWYDWQEEPDEQSYTMTYDWKGNLSKQVLNWGDNRGIVIWEYRDGLCIHNTTYEADGNTITEYWEYTYDQQDRCIRESRYDVKGSLELYHEYVYDDAARTKTRTCYLADGTVDNYSDVYTYDEYGNEILLEKIRNGEVYWRIQYTYELLETENERS